MLYGVGINDLIDSGNRCNVKTCMFYRTWSNMLQRCYGNSTKPAYAGCSVCVEWHTFSKFKQWMQSQSWEGNHLDKDLIEKGNKEYSPDKCIFIPRQINNFIKCKFTPNLRNSKFQSSIRVQGKQKYIGVFDTEELARDAYYAAKTEELKQLAQLQQEPLKSLLIKQTK